MAVGETPGKMYAMAVIFSMLAIIAVALRFYARYLKRAGYWWDEYMIVPALLFTLLTAIGMIIGAADGDLGRHTAINSNDYPIVTNGTIVLEKVIFAVQLTQTLTFGLTKLSVLFFYKRIFQGTLINLAVWTNIAIVCTWTIGFFFANLLECYPISINWAIPGAQNWDSCINTSMMMLAQYYSDIFTDLMILSLPIPCIWAMTMPARHKLAVSGIFLLGLLTVCSSIAKVVVFNRVNYLGANGDPDFSYLYTPTVYWPMVESSLGIVGACLPLLRPLFSRGSGAKGFGQVRDLRSVRPSAKLASTDGSSPEMKPWAEDSVSDGKSGSVSTIRKLVPSALVPLSEERLNNNGVVEEKGMLRTGRADNNV